MGVNKEPKYIVLPLHYLSDDACRGYAIPNDNLIMSFGDDTGRPNINNRPIKVLNCTNMQTEVIPFQELFRYTIKEDTGDGWPVWALHRFLPKDRTWTYERNNEKWVQTDTYESQHEYKSNLEGLSHFHSIFGSRLRENEFCFFDKMNNYLQLTVYEYNHTKPLCTCFKLYAGNISPERQPMFHVVQGNTEWFYDGIARWRWVYDNDKIWLEASLLRESMWRKSENDKTEYKGLAEYVIRAIAENLLPYTKGHFQSMLRQLEKMENPVVKRWLSRVLWSYQ